MTPPAAAAAPTVRPRRAPAPRAPRRVSGPARAPARPAGVPRQAGAGAASAQPGLILGLLAALEALAQHRLLDRLIRGRVWIGIVAFALIGIVTLQLGLLKLNGGIGRALEHEATLQRENTALSIQNSQLAAGTRVESSAGKLGMAFVPVGALRFLSAGSHADAAKAAAALSTAASAAAQAREAAASEAASASEAEGSEEASGSVEGSASSEGGSSSEASASSEEAGAAEASAASSSSEEASGGAESEASGESPASEAPAG
jgi:cell division protein FtsL